VAGEIIFLEPDNTKPTFEIVLGDSFEIFPVVSVLRLDCDSSPIR
jgi:hypothetical protein